MTIGARERRAGGTDRSAFRADIEGMRAIAVGSVMAWHAGLPWVTGGFVGVDIFFVISGFLMTTVLLREVDAGGHIRIGRFYARRIRRLLPAAATALAGTALLTLTLLPSVRWRSISGDIGGAALYFVNWRFADNAVDYLAQGEAASPVQHFWSLSVEEQFYLVLPVAVALVCLAAAAPVWRRRLLTVFVTVVIGVSLAWSIAYTAADPGRAYFVTTTRMWELALGGLVALAVPLWSRLGRTTAAALSWLGLAAMIAGILYIDAGMPFPGWIAALPTLGAAAVLAAGSRPDGAPRFGAVLVLRPRPMQWIGALSYSLYLWHWPILVAAAAVLGDQDGVLRIRWAVLAVAVCFLPAWLSYRYVEERLRRPPRRLPAGRAAALLLVTCTAVSVGAAATVYVTVDTRVALAREALAHSDDTAQPDSDGTARPDPADTTRPDPADTIRPDPLIARDDLGEIYDLGCQREVAEPIPCWFGDEDASFTVALVGDSHAAHYFPPVRAVAEERGWRLLSLTRPSCPINPEPLRLGDPAGVPSCQSWQDGVQQILADDPPDLIITTAYSRYRPGGETARDGYATVLRTWLDLGSRIVVLADTPAPGFDMVDCVDRHRSHLDRCDFDRERATRPDQLAAAAEQIRAGIRDGQIQDGDPGRPRIAVVDLSDEVCPGTTCRPVQDGILVYRDGHHLTRTFALRLAPALGARLTELGDEPR